MGQSYHLSRKFARIYGATGVWAVAGGGILTLTSGQILLGGFLIAAALVLLVLIVSGRLLKERDYTGTDLFFLFVPMVGVVLMAGIYLIVFPWSYWLFIYLAVLIALSVWSILRLRSSHN